MSAFVASFSTTIQCPHRVAYMSAFVVTYRSAGFVSNETSIVATFE